MSSHSVICGPAQIGQHQRRFRECAVLNRRLMMAASVCGSFPPIQRRISTLLSLVCPVSASSCWVLCSHVSLGLTRPNDRVYCLSPAKSESSNYLIGASTPRLDQGCRHMRGRIIGQRQMCPLKVLQMASCGLAGRRASKRRQHEQLRKSNGGQVLDGEE